MIWKTGIAGIKVHILGIFQMESTFNFHCKQEVPKVIDSEVLLHTKKHCGI